MCPQWSAVIGTDHHHSDKMTTTTNSLTSTKISALIQMLGLASHFTDKVSTRNPGHGLKITKFPRLKTLHVTTTLLILGTFLERGSKF